jgi:hypothetical protein
MDGDTIPPKYTCDGDNTNPPLAFSEIPEGARSLVLIVDDPDAPAGLFTHWTVFNMSPAALQVPDNGLPMTGKQGATDFGNIGYGGPCPPSGGGAHRYCFRLFALDAELNLSEGVSRQDLDAAMNDHLIETAVLAGHYGKD